MGACASCLGRRGDDPFDEDDVSRLLLDDPNNFQYGSFSDQNINPQADPQESQRETEALQKVVARTSNNLVDIFEITPQESQRTHPTMFSGQNVCLDKYQNIISKLLASDDMTSVQGHVDWLSDDDITEVQGGMPGIKEGGEPLVGTFADAATAVA
ncbi:late endosomal/lysosomal adaptor and MAPK and MTOR activator-domain-containing protein [Pseudomassariella vexata]|uniref:Late endosomal/lysosomal adaptor and MAPK and MTOR activator-domain-containing protein n=1 Tax=Pseudomassariella vexata TaxID=1141098 RepID=A0A1Y2DH53_9PEZI|nr:late endosomal/lysosomal adaptor and MAPK and MTOR activator-domain-containing protein [Pseudomassariella vexata]ORY58434.1 late endosomal/lysosomal adaptor and MAPK and MTOR activator-domain-containing protein [Pseudomassariella vexata]